MSEMSSIVRICDLELIFPFGNGRELQSKLELFVIMSRLGGFVIDSDVIKIEELERGEYYANLWFDSHEISGAVHFVCADKEVIRVNMWYSGVVNYEVTLSGVDISIFVKELDSLIGII